MQQWSPKFCGEERLQHSVRQYTANCLAVKDVMLSRSAAGCGESGGSTWTSDKFGDLSANFRGHFVGLSGFVSHQQICSWFDEQLFEAMSVFQEILASIQRDGTALTDLIDPTAITNDAETGPFDGDMLRNDLAWELARRLISDSHRLISLLTPRPIYLLKQAFLGSLPTALGIAAHYKIADQIEKLGGKASLSQLAQLAGTSTDKLGKTISYQLHHG